ncbi:MAG: CDP-diacylglycerol--glycerol-3-phosphate 3-phosphatidyltransferase [Fusobacteria bacterium]|nr:CDP-diacylglycerol--glycerol-3-phosphate 3-phosphatidyltransferase [Fusobacteriota bacterium]
MNLPNKLTVFRMIIVLPFIILLFLGKSNIWYSIGAGIIFGIASLTDFLDGYIARKKGIVTDFGKLMDPLADKILVLSALICFIELGYIPAWMVIIIVIREFLVTGIRVIAASKGEIIPAGKLGKYKTISQMIAIPIILLIRNEYVLANQLIMLIPVILTVWSGYQYVMNSKEYFKH